MTPDSRPKFLLVATVFLHSEASTAGIWRSIYIYADSQTGVKVMSDNIVKFKVDW